MLELLASAARGVSGNAVLTKPPNPERIAGGIFMLNVTAAATDATDTLDVYLQSSIDEGVTYDDFVHFTQVLGNGGAKKFLAEWMARTGAPNNPETEMHAPSDAAMAAGVKQGPVGPLWRVKWVIVDPGAGVASFTFSLAMQPIHFW